MDDLKALAAFHSDDYPVGSLYLDVRPEQHQRSTRLNGDKPEGDDRDHPR